MNFPLILQDIDGKNLPKTITTDKSSFFIKSYKRFDISIKNNFDYDFEDEFVDLDENFDELDNPFIYSVIQNGIVLKEKEFFNTNSNYSYTIYLGKTEKEITLEIYDSIDVEGNNPIFITINYKPNNLLLEEQEHYDTLLINYDLPKLDELLPIMIIDSTKSDLIKKLLLDFYNLKKERGKLKSIEKFLYFIGFNHDNIKLFPEYKTPEGKTTITPNKLLDVKTGYYHLHYDNFKMEDNKYTRKNLPNFILNITDFSEFFEKLFKALVLAHDYFTIPEQEMSFFGISNMVNSEQFLSITSTTTQVQYINTLVYTDFISIDLYNRTLLDSLPLMIIDNRRQLINEVKRSEVKIYIGNNPILNNNIYKIEREFTDNQNDTNLTDEEELQTKRIFGNVFNLDLKAKDCILKYKIINVQNQLIQYTSNEIIFNGYETKEEKIFIKESGEYYLTFEYKDYYGNKELYFYTVFIKGANIDFKLFSSNNIIEDNKLTQDIDSPIVVNHNTNNKELINAQNNIELDIDFKNYFDIVNNYEHKNLLGEKQFRLKNLNHNILMSDLTETLFTDYIDNFLELMSFKKLDNVEYIFPEQLEDEEYNIKVLEMDIVIDESNVDLTEKYYLLTTGTSSTDFDFDLHDIKIIHNNKEYNTKSILNKELPEELDYRITKIPLNYNVGSYQSVFPKLNLQTNEQLKQGDILVGKINDNLIVNDSDLIWNIYNSFTKELLHTQKQKTLKYRLEDNLLYDVELKLKIDNIEYKINQNSIISSFSD